MYVRNPDPKHDWKTGDRCHFYNQADDAVLSGTVTSIRPAVALTPACANVRCDTYCDNWQEPLDCLFPSLRDAEDAVRKEHERRVARYSALMPDVDGLIRFAHKNGLSRPGPNRDTDARKAFRLRARDLLGIDIDERE